MSFLFIICFFLGAFLTFGNEAPKKFFFKEHQKKILNAENSVKSYAKTIYAIGYSTSTLGEETACDKAELWAKRKILEHVVLKNVDWPKKFSNKLKRSLVNNFLKLSNYSLYLKHSQVVDRTRLKNNKYRVVIAVPREGLKISEVTYSRIKRTFKNAFKENNADLNYKAFLEICDPSKSKKVIEKLAQTKRSDVLSSIIKGESLKTADKFQIFNERKDKIKNLKDKSIKELTKKLNLFPYSPKICYFLGKKYNEIGFNRHAQLFYQRGTKFWINPKYRKLCDKNLERKLFNYSKNKVCPNLLKKIRKLLRNKTSAKLNLLRNKPNSKLIINSFGSIPIEDKKTKSKLFKEGNKLFYSSPPKIDKAINKYINAIEEKISADLSNMIGACLREKGKFEISVPFFHQAINMNPEHKYAYVNLAIVIKKLGYSDLASKIAKKVSGAIYLNEWGKNQLKKLKR